jgi:hypothetical protein
MCCCRSMFTEPFPSNSRIFQLHYSGIEPSCHNILIWGHLTNEPMHPVKECMHNVWNFQSSVNNEIKGFLHFLYIQNVSLMKLSPGLGKKVTEALNLEHRIASMKHVQTCGGDYFRIFKALYIIITTLMTVPTKLYALPYHIFLLDPKVGY